MKAVLCIIMFGVMNTMGYGYSYKPQTHDYIPPPAHCYDLKYNNPCTKLDLNLYGFHYPSCTDKCHFIQCSESGEAFERPTACGTKWDKYLEPAGGQVSCPNNDCSNICPHQLCPPPRQYEPEYPPKYEPEYEPETPRPTVPKYEPKYEPEYPPKEPEYEPAPKEPEYEPETPNPTVPRIIDYTPKKTTTKKPYIPQTPPPNNMCYTKYNNPCAKLTPEQIKNHEFYYPSCTDKCHFIQCSEYGQVFDMPTACGTKWDQSLPKVGGQVACEDNDCANICPNQKYDVCDQKSTTKSPPVCYTVYNAPCAKLTAEQIKNHEFYYPSCTDPCHFIQCSEHGAAFDMPTACGTRWEPSLPKVGGQVACPNNDCLDICPTQRCNRKYGY